MARVAVITRTKDRPLMLPRARASIEQQTFRNFVWVLVNDAGVREHVEVNAEQARNKGIDVRVLHREVSTGMEAASNAGICASDSEFIVIHDDDDSWHPEYLEKCVRFLDNTPEVVGVVTYSQAVHEKIENGQVVEMGRNPYNSRLESIQLADMVQQNLFAPISFLFKRSVYDAVGGFDESLPVLGDWDFNLRVLLKGDIGLLPEMLANYHIREKVAPDQVIYGNSITAGVNIHMIQDARYRNLKLRQDIEQGRVGLGFLLCQGRQMLRMSGNLDIVARVLRVPQRVWKSLRHVMHRRKKVSSKSEL